MRLRPPALVGVVALVAFGAFGCASPPVQEEQEEVGDSIDEMGTCTIARVAAGAAARVAVRAWIVTGGCAAGALVATAGTGEVVCLAPAAGASIATIASLFAQGVAYLSCSRLNMSSEELTLDESQPARTSKLTCSEEEHEELKAKKAEICDRLNNSCRNVDLNRNADQVCQGLAARRREFEKCRDIRQEVTDRCFGGVHDKTHQEQVDAMEEQIRVCDELLSTAECPSS
jgi:hypothetical protein